jgi:hypothetical protein
MAAHYDTAIYTQEELEELLAHWKTERKKVLVSHSVDGVSVQRIRLQEIEEQLAGVLAALRRHDPEEYGAAVTGDIKVAF